MVIISSHLKRDETSHTWTPTWCATSAFLAATLPPCLEDLEEELHMVIRIQTYEEMERQPLLVAELYGLEHHTQSSSQATEYHTLETQLLHNPTMPLTLLPAQQIKCDTQARTNRKR